MKAPDKGGEWGILGGAFDPVHYGHLTLASEIFSFKKLSGILLVPSVKHPFKSSQCHASYPARLEMLKLAVEYYDGFFVSDIEKEYNLSGYTLDTIKAIKNKYTEATFYFLIGADNLSQLHLWYKPEEIFKEIIILAGTRPSFEPSINLNGINLPDDKIEFISTKPVDVSSTVIRQLLKKDPFDEKLKAMLPLNVSKYIRQKKLYL